MMRLALLVALCVEAQARVLLVSLDGMGYAAFADDPVTVELRALREVAARGALAEGMTPHFPSTTANSHAALFTGAWGDVNGITSNSVPALPRAAHTFAERVNGYRSDALRAEPLWVAAGRQGIRAVALQVPQAYPFRPQSVGENLAAPPVVVNGYQTRLIARGALLSAASVEPETCPAGSGSDRCFAWSAGPVKMHGRLQRDGGVYRSIAISASGREVAAIAAPLETEPPRTRPLARHFSDGLWLEGLPGGLTSVVYFRLFECAGDGSSFRLYQSPIYELGVHHGTEPGPALAERVQRAAGGFIGNGPEHELMREPFALGTPLWKGGDGSAERRYLEICELITRQAIRHAEWFLEQYRPELMIGYLPFPDEIEHAWKGAPLRHPGYTAMRQWGYAIVNRYAAFYTSAARPDDHVVFVSDHGMTVIEKDVDISGALRHAGLGGRAGELRNCILLNSSDWKDGVVSAAQRPEVVGEVERALLGIRDPASGERVITRFYDTAADAERFGYGGPNGADLCFDFLPGYGGAPAFGPPFVRTRPVPGGEHGFDPTRPAMQAILMGAGPKLPAGTRWRGLRSIDVAPLIADLLGIRPPRDARGRSPLR